MNKAPIRMLTADDVFEMTSLARSSLYRHIANGDFPKPIKLSKRRVAWDATDVENWLSSRVTSNPFPIGTDQRIDSKLRELALLLYDRKREGSWKDHHENLTEMVPCGRRVDFGLLCDIISWSALPE